MRAPRRIAPDRRVRRRREWEDTRRPAWVMWLSVICLVGLAVAVIALTGSERMSRPQAVNGDALGPVNGESLDDYVDRARASLQESLRGPDDPRWALVTPERPAGTDELADVFSGMAGLRVSTLLSGETRSAVPEPSDGHRRVDVFAAARAQAATNAGVGVDDPSLDVVGVLVRGNPGDLDTLDGRDGVLCVEALPPDAGFGRFGLRPVTAEMRGPHR